MTKFGTFLDGRTLKETLTEGDRYIYIIFGEAENFGRKIGIYIKITRFFKVFIYNFENFKNLGSRIGIYIYIYNDHPL